MRTVEDILAFPEISHSKLKKLMAEGAQRALEGQKAGTWKPTLKPDGTPVTTLDLELHELFLKELPKILDVPVVSEEGAWEGQEGLESFWCVDPLDGTKHFIQGSRDFALCVALIWEGYPVLGALEGPAWAESYYAHKGGGVELNGQKLPSNAPRPAPIDRVVLTSDVPSQRLQDLLFHLNLRHHQRQGSVIKLAHLADGSGHFYPRFGPTREWDTAAGQAVLEAAGGELVDARTFERLKYGKPGFLNHGFLAWGPNVFSKDELETLKKMVGLYGKR